MSATARDISKKISRRDKVSIEVRKKPLCFGIPAHWREILDELTKNSPERLATHCREIFEAGLQAKGFLN